MTRRTPIEDIVAAYKRTGSVWKAGKELGIAGQTVHERLRALGYPIAGRRWSDEEDAYLVEMIRNGVTAGKAAERLGRTFAGVTCRLNELGITGYRSPRQRKVPRGAGYDKDSVGRYLREIKAGNTLPTRYCRAHGLDINLLAVAAQKHYLADWQAIAAKAGLATRECSYCNVEFHPANGKQRYCTRTCGSRALSDATYFGGRRSEAIGMAEGVCQLCGRQGHHKLAAHHVIGKENDPDNEVMVALCNGCHNVITSLGGRAFLNDTAAWETLISLAWLRKHGATLPPGKALYVCVELAVEDDEACDAGTDDETELLGLAPCVVLEPLGEVAAHELGDGHALVESGQVQAPEQVS